MKYGSVCSGVEAASMAWEPLGFEPVFFSEIEPFPSAVLAHHWPSVPNCGDMTKFEDWNYEQGSIDILVGGTPCQSFSVAGLRNGLSDSRGNLALTYCRMVDRLRPRWFIWENVPGVLSSGGGRDFGSILGAMAQLGYSFAWRLLDAQNFGVPQRRRRVFLVGCSSGDWRDPASVLFERDCGSRDFEKSRKERKENTESSVKCFAGNKESTVAATVQTTMHDYSRADGFNTIIHGSQDPITSNKAHAIGRNQGQENVLCFEPRSQDGVPRFHGDISPTLNTAQGGQRQPCVVFESHPTDSRVKQLNSASSTVTVKWAKGTADTPLCVDRLVRRLTPVEAERLQGFPDNHTNIAWRKKEESPDWHRYKAMGNSMAVPVMRWIGKRIRRVENGR